MVKLRSDQERVKALLKETITLLCKNGLEYKSRFCVDALIGITLDEDDVFLVKITETVNDRGLGNTNGTPAPLNFSTHSPPMVTPPQLPPMVTIPQIPPPVHDVQIMHESLRAQSNSSPQTSTASSTPAQRKSPMPRKQATPQPLSLTQNRKRRASSSPVRLVIDRTSPEPERPTSDIPEQQVATPGAISNVSELSNQSAPSQEPTPITVEPTSPDVEELHEEPISLKRETVSDVENEPAPQDAPLNMSKPTSDKALTDAGCSTWDPATIQQQVAQAAAATLSGKVSESPKTTPNQSTDGSAPPTEQDVSWSLLKTALKTKQKGGRQPNEENDVGYYYALSNPQYQLEKRYVCDFAGCNYTSSRKYNLMRHGRTHHEDQRIPCPECPGTFVDKYILKEHMAAAHPKFTIPIEGTNMIGVGIGNTNQAQQPGGTPTGEQGSKRKRSLPSHNPSPSVARPNKGKESPKSKRRSGGWHIPRLVPMQEGSGIGERAATVKDGDTVEGAELKLNVEPFLQENGSSNSMMDTSLGDQANNNVSKSAYEPVSAGFSLASMQAVFPGMDMMSIAKDPDLSNNNTPKVQEEQSAPTDLSSNMQVVFPGMEMEDSNGAPDTESDVSAVKDRSMIETSDGEEVKVSE